MEIPVPPPPGVEAEPIPLEILYEDEDLAVINKPAGMIVHPGAGADSGTMVAALLHRFGGIEGFPPSAARCGPGIVHRLDKGNFRRGPDRAHRRRSQETGGGISRTARCKKPMSRCCTEK